MAEGWGEGVRGRGRRAGVVRLENVKVKPKLFLYLGSTYRPLSFYPLAQNRKRGPFVTHRARSPP